MRFHAFWNKSDGIKAGAKVIIPPFESVLDLKEPKKSKPLKLEPTFEKIFEAEAQLTATAGISLPVAVGIGVVVAPVNFKKDLEIVEKPTIMVRTRLFGDVVILLINRC